MRKKRKKKRKKSDVSIHKKLKKIARSRHHLKAASHATVWFADAFHVPMSFFRKSFGLIARLPDEDFSGGFIDQLTPPPHSKKRLHHQRFRIPIVHTCRINSAVAEWCCELLCICIDLALLRPRLSMFKKDKVVFSASPQLQSSISSFPAEVCEDIVVVGCLGSVAEVQRLCNL